jgi:hypothetical protein
MKQTFSIVVLGALMQEERIQRLADQARLLRIEPGLEAALQATESMPGIRVLFANHIVRQLVVLDEPHAGSLSPWEPVAVLVLQWIGRRIAAVDATLRETGIRRVP